MIYGKIWLVVKPSVGVPLFLSAVVIGSLAVHLALLTNTTWVKKFLQGNEPVKTSAADVTTAAAPPVLTQQ
jgi:light-harvesting protein B-800-850 alpha chain